MKKRKFIKTTSALVVGSAVVPIIACKSDVKSDKERVGNDMSHSDFVVPKLPYAFDALAPNIDAQTMEIHHGKHHAGYVRKFNAALEGTDYKGRSIEDILGSIGPEDTGLRNNGGGHYNHSLFWSSMSPKGGGMPSGDLADAINTTFGDFDNFKSVFSNAAKTRFGSGWAWLVKDNNGKLFVTSTPNQDNPLMSKIEAQTGIPILGIDVWEHAYYLNYQNRRGDYVGNFFNIIDWDKVAERLG